MDNSNIEKTDNVYHYCTVQLNAFSLMLITSLSGFCGGVVWAAILVVAKWLGITELEKFDGLIDVFIGFPVVGALGGGLFAIVGYPLYSWTCKNIRGQKLKGTFHNPYN